MFSNIIAGSSALLALSSMAMAAPQNKPTPQPDLTTQLQLAPSAADRFALLPDDKDFVFEFGKKGALADRKTFPALVGTGSALATAELGACGLAAAHVHPRSAELFVVLKGRILTEMVPESAVRNPDGSQRVVKTELGPNMMTVFPQGSFHTQINPDCDPAVAVASFASEDPGAGLIVPQTFAMSNQFINGNFGQNFSGEDIDSFREHIPQGAITVIEECLKKCNIKKRSV
ncbi:related to spherulin 1A precursor [Cephalotrichum gorgonifer]|uniref:Related to spherulin 1A n=1 Tax=Cephalotrichum gorgonifer TaxID=2041049 RepID=A0AAE8N4L5_9PEZI|nr:related to spherulin 1A precursor [Cephalotrichum gorgonifer]